MTMDVQKLNMQLAEALGLNPHLVENIHLILEAKQAPKVIVTYVPTPNNLAAVADVIRLYQLVERP
jgi:hypothetical protein